LKRFGLWISLAVWSVVTHGAAVVRAQSAGAADVQADEDVEVTASPAPPPTAASPAAPVVVPTSPASAPESAEQSPAAQAAPSPSTAAVVNEASSAPTPTAAAAPASDHERIEALEARLRMLEQKPQPSAARPAPPDVLEGPFGFQLAAYVQGQYEASQQSEDQLQQGGLPLNRNRFVVRRARLLIARDYDYAQLRVELDANTVRTITVGVRRAEASLVWRNPAANAPPYLKTTVGLQDIPFGAELPAGARQRIFMERSVASQAFFPNEADIGVSLGGGVGPLRYSLALLNGQVADSAVLAAVDPNAAKDLVGRVGVEVAKERWLSIAGGVSALGGKGFHAGNDSTKNALQWNDVNEDGTKSETEISGVPGSGSTPSKNFERWAIGADVSLGLRTRIGWSRLSAELTFANNLDRGWFVADPIATSSAARELGYSIGFVQEITRYGLLGFRTDYYDGNSDAFERRRGSAVPANQSLRSYSPLVGLVLPERARLLFQYDFIVDSLARDNRGVPTGLRNNQWTLRLQVGI
jgi:hypothetical protein